MTRNKLGKLWIPALLLVLAGMTFAQTAAPAPTSGKTPEQRLRELYYRGDSDLVTLEGKPLVAQPNVSLEARAWYFTQAINTQAISSNFARSLPLASVLDGMQKAAPHDPWTLLARAAAASNLTEAAAWCHKAVAISSNPDVLVLCIGAMAQKVQTGKDNELTEFLEQHRRRIEASADALMAQADALEQMARRSAGNLDLEQRAVLFDRALKLAPHNTRAAIGKLYHLQSLKRTQEAVELAEQALTWSGLSAPLHQAYWKVIGGLSLSDEEKGRRIEADAVRLLQQTRPGPWPIFILLIELRQYSDTRAVAIGDLVLKLYPDSPAADQVLVERASAKLRPYQKGVTMPRQVRQQVAAELIAYVKRSEHRSWYAENGAHNHLRTLLVHSRSNDVDAEQLFTMAKAGRIDDAPDFAVEALNRKAHVAEIKQLAATRIDEMLRDAKDRNREWQLGSLATREMSSFWKNLSNWYDVLGWAELQEGHIEEAAAKLATAEKLNDSNINPPLHLGKLYEAKKDFAKAESYYNRALTINWYFEGEHPAIQSYRDLYVSKQGSTKGIETYLAAVYEKDRARRKPRILAERIKEPQPIPPFGLKTLDGKTVNSDDLKGRVVVINFWGTWCGPCIKEMPEFQRLYEKYKRDPAVVILTIDSGDEVETVQEFITQKKYSFPVLLQTEYATKANVTAFPTTWFLDRNGNKAFEKRGVTIDLEAEFSWRIEALRSDPNAGTVRSPTGK